MNPLDALTDVVPARLRKYIYALYALAGVVVGALAVAGVDVGKAPDVLTYLGAFLGVVAAANTDPKPPAKPEGVRIYQPGADEDGFGGDAPDPYMG